MTITRNESPRLAELITSCESIPPHTLVSKTADMFFASPRLEAVALTEGGEPVGLVTRAKLFTSLSRRFGFELYSKKPIVKIAEPEPLTLSEGERLETALQKALHRPTEHIYDEIITVSEAGCYRGLISVKHLVIQQSHILANSIVQRELAHERARNLLNLLGGNITVSSRFGEGSTFIVSLPLAGTENTGEGDTRKERE